MHNKHGGHEIAHSVPSLNLYVIFMRVYKAKQSLMLLDIFDWILCWRYTM